MHRSIMRPSQTGMARSTTNDRQRAGLYPSFFKLTKNTSGIYQDEHQRTMDLVAAGASDSQLRILVERIHQERHAAAQKVLDELEVSP
jgi:hypothetical protein